MLSIVKIQHKNISYFEAIYTKGNNNIFVYSQSLGGLLDTLKSNYNITHPLFNFNLN